jgi:hypothetical protein
VRITHPFHPRSGQELELVVTRHLGGEPRVCLEAAGGLVPWLPRRWTSLEAVGPFVERSQGRASFRTRDLIELAHPVERQRTPPPAVGGRHDVSGDSRRECQRNDAARAGLVDQ